MAVRSRLLLRPLGAQTRTTRCPLCSNGHGQKAVTGGNCLSPCEEKIKRGSHHGPCQSINPDEGPSAGLPADASCINRPQFSGRPKMTRSKLIKLTAPHRHKVGRNTLFLVVDSQACLHEGTHLANLPGNKGDSCCKNESLAVDPFGQPQVQQHEGDAENLDDKDA